MSTHSIIIVPENDEWHVIYCHWDGFLDSVGKTLRDVFDTTESALELISLGDCSSIHLAEDIDDVVAYCRDKDEAWEGVQPHTYDTLAQAVAANDEKYIYAFVDGEWRVKCQSNLLCDKDLAVVDSWKEIEIYAN